MADFKLNHLHFKTADPKATADWYVNNLGATVVQEIGDIGYKLDLHGIPMNVTTLVEGTTHRAVLRAGARSHRHQ